MNRVIVRDSEIIIEQNAGTSGGVELKRTLELEKDYPTMARNEKTEIDEELDRFSNELEDQVEEFIEDEDFYDEESKETFIEELRRVKEELRETL